MEILKVIDQTKRIISQAEARRIAKQWGNRLPSNGRRLIQSKPVAQGLSKILYRNELAQWIVAEYEI